MSMNPGRNHLFKTERLMQTLAQNNTGLLGQMARAWLALTPEERAAEERKLRESNEAAQLNPMAVYRAFRQASRLPALVLARAARQSSTENCQP